MVLTHEVLETNHRRLLIALNQPRLPGLYRWPKRLFGSFHIILTLCLDITQQSTVVRSGSAMNDWIASPMVTVDVRRREVSVCLICISYLYSLPRVVSLKRQKTRAITMILIRLVMMTIARMVVENWS
jgi:hypothetical protein